jgi:hypothetical protein
LSQNRELLKQPLYRIRLKSVRIGGKRRGKEIVVAKESVREGREIVARREELRQSRDGLIGWGEVKQAPTPLPTPPKVATQSTARRVCATRLVMLREVEVKSDVDGLTTPLGGKSGHFVDAEQSAHSGIVHGAIAAGLHEANIFDRTIAENGEGDNGVGGTRGANWGVDGVLHPIVLHALGDTGDIPRIARGEFGATLASEGGASRGRHRSGLGTVTGRNIQLPALAVGDGIFGRRRFILESSRSFPGWRRGLEFVEFWNLEGVGFNLGRLGWLFLSEALGGIDYVAVGEDIRLGHGQAGTADEIHFDAGISGATDTTPRDGVTLNPNAKEEENGKAKVHEGGIAEKGLEVEFFGIGSVVVHGNQLLRARSLIGWVTMEMLEMPDSRRESMTEAKAPKGTVSSQRRKMASWGRLSCFLILSGSWWMLTGSLPR